MYQTEHFSLFLFIDTLKKETDIDSSIRPSDLEGIISDEECEDRSFEEVKYGKCFHKVNMSGKVYFSVQRNNKVFFTVIGEIAQINVLGTEFEMEVILQDSITNILCKIG